MDRFKVTIEFKKEGEEDLTKVFSFEVLSESLGSYKSREDIRSKMKYSTEVFIDHLNELEKEKGDRG